MFSLNRKIDSIETELFDLAIVGGGITGAGIARQAADAGLKTLLCEANDFASGTSSRSTKLIHGGLRYLAMGDVGLVRESLLERTQLRIIAPHLVQARWMVLPVESWLQQSKFQLAIGAYERLGRVASGDREGLWRGPRLAREIPGLDVSKYSSACVYREYLTDDARLVLANLRSAAGNGAMIANHMEVSSIVQDRKSCTLQLLDRLTGESLAARARIVVNAAGPWAESLLPKQVGAPRLQLSKGVHIVVPHSRLPLQHMLVLRPDDGRMLFAIPRGDVTYIGTTDSAYQEPPTLWPEVTGEEIDYLLEPLKQYFPGSDLSRNDIVTTWAGLRPLVYQRGKAPREMSRKEELWTNGRLLTIAGGKLTGYRKMAEDVMIQVGDQLDRTVTMANPLACLPGGDQMDLSSLTQSIQRQFQMDEFVATRLVRLYGSEVNAVLALGDANISRSLKLGEIDWGVLEEGARTLEDLIYRRLGAAWFRHDELADIIPQAAVRMGQLLEWSDARRREELDRLEQRLKADRSPV